MKISAERIATLINGKVDGDGSVTVSSFGKIEEANNDQLTFFANKKYEEFLYKSKASVIILSEYYVLKQPVNAVLIRVADAYLAFATLLHKHQQMMQEKLTGIEQPSFIHSTAQIGENAYIGAFTYIGENASIAKNVKLYPGVYIGDDVRINSDSVLYPGVKIYNNCIIGSNVIIHASTVIGSDGFGFAPESNGAYKKIPQIGNVVIEDLVEIGSNVTIDRATIGSTIIKSGVKLDNLIHIAHNVEIGTNTVIAAQAGISGSTKIGKNVMIGGQAGIVGHLQIADGSKINAQSGVSKSLKTPNTAVTGSPAFDYTSALRSQAISRKLPELEKKLLELEKVVQQIASEKVSY